MWTFVGWAVALLAVALIAGPLHPEEHPMVVWLSLPVAVGALIYYSVETDWVLVGLWVFIGLFEIWRSRRDWRALRDHT